MSTTTIDFIKIQRTVLHGTGVWPEEDPSLPYKLRGLITFSIIALLAATMLIEVINDITDFTKLSEILYITVTIYAYIIKHVCIFRERKTFNRMIKILNSPVFTNYPKDLNYLTETNSRLCQFLTNLYRCLTLLCSVLMSVSPLLDNQPLPFPFSYDLGRYRIVMYVFQVIAINVGAWNHPCIDSLAASLISLAATQLQILGEKIIRVQESSQKDGRSYESNVKLRECVKHHLTIIEFIECVDQIFSFCVMIQFLGSIIVICNTLFQFILVETGSGQYFMLISYLLYVLSQLFMYCWFGNEVIWMSMKIREACYFSNWYTYKKQFSKYLFIMMERSKNPLKVTVYKFSILSLSSFTSIIQWSYSYFALLNKLYKKQPQASK